MQVKKKSEESEKKTIKKKTSKKEAAEEKVSLTEKEDKLAKLKAKAEALAGKMETKEIDVSKEMKKEQKPGALAPIEDYLKSSIHLGTRAITPDMKPYVYKRRADSLAVFNTSSLTFFLKSASSPLIPLSNFFAFSFNLAIFSSFSLSS